MSTAPNDDPIKHVVVLMMENHSFDQMLGCLKQVYPELEGVDPTNPYSNFDLAGKRFSQAPTTERQMLLDPHHEVGHVAIQLENHNGGFVKDFDQSFSHATPPCTDQDKQFIMGYYSLNFLPALHALAQEFTICDHWFSSLPGPTWPNRFFVLSGTANGRVAMPGDETHKVDLPGWFEQDQPTIFDRLSEKGIHWKVYFHDAPQSWVLCHQRRPENVARYFYISRFHADARGLADDFPAFCFIEPDFMGYDENDDHPPHDIMKAEKLIADVYNSLRANPDLWKSTLLVIIYDEHGGFYDHVEPPEAIQPDNHREEYTFDRLGLRVPALLVSPCVKQGVERTQFDHTSLLKYLIDKWGLGPLGKRTEAATSIGVAIRTGEPIRENTLERIELTADQLAPPDPGREEQAADVETAHHKALAAMWPYTKAEADERLPRISTAIARFFEAIKDVFDYLARFFYGEATAMSISPSQPDHISGKQGKWAVLHQHFAVFLSHQKTMSVSVLAGKIRDVSLPLPEREHAVRALASLTGRKFHRTPETLEQVGESGQPVSPPAVPDSAGVVYKVPLKSAFPPVPPQGGSAVGTTNSIASADEWLKLHHH